MQRRTARGLGWSAAALGALLAALAWLAGSRGPGPARATGEDRPRAPAELDALAPAEIAGPEPSATRAPVAPGAPVLTGAPDEPDGAPEDAVVVRVVRASDGEPLGGAEVRVFDPATLDWLELEERVGRVASPVELAAKHHFVRFETDARGVARVPHPLGEGSVTATHGTLWARGALGPLTREVVLALEPDLALDVRVVGPMAPGGPVAGIDVVLQQRTPGGPYVHQEDQERTGPDGRARFEHLAPLRALAREHGLELSVCTRVLALDAPMARLDLDAWPADGVTLTLPPTGALRFELVEPDGTRSSAGGEVEVALDAAQRARLAREGRPPPIVEVTIDLAGGVARLDPIGLGLELQYQVMPHGWKSVSDAAAGPAAAGEEARVVVRAGAPAPTVRGRLVDRDGAPLANASLACEIWSEKEPARRTERCRTDAHGRFEGLGGPYMLDDGAWWLYLSIAGDPLRAARIELVAPVAPGVHDAGDVVLDLPPLVASGTVVSGGTPVRAARLECEEEVERAWLPEGARWGLPRGIATTDSSGRFELRAWPSGQRLRLRVRRDGFVASGPHEFRAPRADWTIELATEAAIAGRVLGAPGRLADLFHFGLARAGGDATDRRPDFGADGSFRIGGLTAGTHALELRLANQLPGAFAWDAIDVRDGQTTELGALRFEDVVRTFRFDVVDGAGERITGARLSARLPGSDHVVELGSELAPDGATLLRTLELPLPDITVSAPGCRPVTLADVHSDRRVVLERGPLVHLVLSDALVVGEAWSAWARPMLDGVDAPAVAFDATGRASTRLSVPGRWWIRIAFQRADRPGFSTISGLTWQIEVTDAPDEQTFTAPPFSPDVLAELERFAR